MSAPATNGKKSVMEIIGEAIPIIVVGSSIGGMALVPLYIKAEGNKEAIETLERRFSEHEKLPGHPVTVERMAAEFRRVDDRITVNDKWTLDIQRDLGTLSGSFQAEKSRSEIAGTEVETQIDSMAQSLAIQFTQQQRFDADIQNCLRDLKAIMPGAPPGPWYVPNISNRNHTK